MTCDACQGAGEMILGGCDCPHCGSGLIECPYCDGTGVDDDPAGPSD
jgi:hypothetical protein